MTGQVANIEQKLISLIEELKNLRSENDVLSEENKKLKADLAVQSDRIGNLTQRLYNTQQALAGQRGDNDQESSQKLRKQIDQYIDEIDKCIAWLQNAWKIKIKIEIKIKIRISGDSKPSIFDFPFSFWFWLK